MGKKLLFSMIFLAALSFTVADSLFGLTKSGGDHVIVPNYLGSAEDEIIPPEWLSIRTDYRYDSEIPAGTVMEQSPAGGSQRKVSERRPCELHLTVSLGTEQKTLPDVCGQDIREAAALLRRNGFSVCEKPTEGTAAGIVQRTEPPAGSAVPLGSSITVYVYSGEQAGSLKVPNLLGLSRGNALLQIFLGGLSAGEVTEEPSDEPDGTVIRQSPVAGSLVGEGTKIKLTVSKQNTRQEDQND